MCSKSQKLSNLLLKSPSTNRQSSTSISAAGLLNLKFVVGHRSSLCKHQCLLNMSTPLKELTAEELVNKGIAPVKREYWKPYATRSEVPAVGGAQAQASATLAEKKSKRQAKKVRLWPLPTCPASCHLARVTWRMGQAAQVITAG